MSTDCYPVAAVPHRTRLFEDYLAELGAPGPRGKARGRSVLDPDRSGSNKLDRFYSPLRRENRWMEHSPTMDPAHRRALAEELRRQNLGFGASPAALSNLDRLEQGAAAVVTGQQAGLFGGPLLTLLKAASAIRLAADASRKGHPHVPVFWVASEDHDFEEINQAAFPAKQPPAIETLRLPANRAPGRPIGTIPLGEGILPLIEELRRCLGGDPICDLLATLYTPEATFASAFASFLSHIFAEHGLIVIDAAARPFHALAAGTLRQAILHSGPIRAALLERTNALEREGYHAQVAVGGSSSLLFLIDEATGIRTALKNMENGSWAAGAAAGDRRYSSADLLAILDQAPERLSPNVLLRPVMQDALLPTSVYIGGPAEIAYFAQSQVAYEQILGRVTPILPRFSATLIGPRLADVLKQHGLTLDDIFSADGELAQRLAARAMPVEGKRKLAAAGEALDRELKMLTEWMHGQNPNLGHSADVAAGKMTYQMNRLRRLSATLTLEREQSLQRHADALSQMLYPGQQLQERVLAGAWFLAQFPPSLPDRWIEHVQCNGAHWALFV